MAFCLLARNRLTGTLALLSSVSFADADEVLGVLTELVNAGDFDAGALEPLIVDVNGAARVLVMGTSMPLAEETPGPVPASVPAAGAWEAPSDAQPEPLEAPIAEPIVEGAPLEAEVSEPGPKLEPEPTPASAVESRGERAPELEPESVPLDVVTEPVSASLIPDRFAVEPVAGLEPAPTPWERIAVPVVEETEPLKASDLTAGEAAPAAGDVGEPQAETDVLRNEVPASEQADVESQTAELSPPELPVEALPVIVMEAGPYEVSGELVLERYTCSDCVYANTCPKVGQSTPAECGSFQWNVT